MTGGRVVVLGHTGRNFAAGMSGGIAYVYDPEGTFLKRCNLEMVLLERIEDVAESADLRGMIQRHVANTGSAVGQRVLDNWQDALNQFVRVIPKDFKRMTEQIERIQATGLTGEAALLGSV